jgi:mannose-6-phosphate isomerase-like protein (cupin superfamily)
LSLDRALLEHASNVAVIPTALRWNDVGSLLALDTLGAPDAAGNIRLGRGVDVDSRGVTVYASGRLVATLGLEDAVVVDTADATLVCRKDRCQDLRAVVEALKAQGDTNEVVEPSTSLRAWGSWTTILRGDGFLIKSVEVKPGAATGMHAHARRSECWVVLAGEARVRRDAEWMKVQASESVHIPPGVLHALENPGDAPLKVIEVQVGDALGEEDITRTSPHPPAPSPNAGRGGVPE